MRAGCFAETRVIQLLNRRFVPFYYNTGGPGQGKDAAAAAFVKDKVGNTYAFFAAFDAAGEPLGVTDVYATKHTTFDFLVALLRQNPEFDRNTPEEEAILRRARDRADDPVAQVAAGQLLEELGRYREAERSYRAALALTQTGAPATDACRGLLRLVRHGQQWGELEVLLAEFEKRNVADRLGLAVDLDMERGYALLAQQRYAELRTHLEAAIRRHPDSKRHSELRFYAGVAAFFLKDKDRAYYHWCWVVENLPDDRLSRRCAIAAAHEGMPYANPELGGYAAPLSGGNIQVINAAYERARMVYERLKDRE